MKTSMNGLAFAATALLALGLIATPLDAQAGQDAQEQVPAVGPKFGLAADELAAELKRAVAELNALRAEIAAEKIPLSRELTALEGELSLARSEFKDTNRTLNGRTLDLSNLQGELEKRQAESAFLSNLLRGYIDNFESRVHIAELQRYGADIEAAKLAPEAEGLSDSEAFAEQARLLSLSLDRLEEALGGARFEGEAVMPSGLVSEGAFLVLGPTALFQPGTGGDVAMAEQRIGSLQPTVVPFGSPEDVAAANGLMANGAGFLPFDPTLGNAIKIEGTKESFLEHVNKGGAVMIPIFAMAGLGLAFALYKWVSMALIGRPSRKRVTGFLDAVGRKDAEGVQRHVAQIKGPVGEMLGKGVEIMDEPRELVEETMYETVLTTRLKLQSFLPFIAICAASAPLLGLLGTVTGIINTFKMITVFGSGDVKSLSGGISEALITTKFGLIVAIPALLLHAFLSRKAKRIVDQMEQTAVAFTNELGRAHYATEDAARSVPLSKVVLRDASAATIQPAQAEGWPPADADAQVASLEARVEALAAQQAALLERIDRGFQDLSVKTS